MKGGRGDIDGAGDDPEAASRPTSGRATKAVGVVAMPEGSFTAACAALCVCLLHG